MVKIKKHLRKRGKILLIFLSLLCISFVQAQERLNISGVVSDTNGEPLVGVSVLEKGTTNGVATDIDGKYKLSVNHRTITRPEQALQGKTAGVQIVQTSGAPGKAPEVRVRGYSSNASSSPLFVVDGVRTANIGGIDPNDIASMEVLKDAASAAIYGAEAGNGVILITTKRGKAGFSKISYDFQYSAQSLARVPKMLNAEQYIDYMCK